MAHDFNPFNFGGRGRQCSVSLRDSPIKFQSSQGEVGGPSLDKTKEQVQSSKNYVTAYDDIAKFTSENY